MKGALQLRAGYPELPPRPEEPHPYGQLRASFAVSREVLLTGQLAAKSSSGSRPRAWGAKIIDRLSHDLQLEFPGVEGYSPRNLKYLRTLAEVWPDPAKVPQLEDLCPGATSGFSKSWPQLGML